MIVIVFGYLICVVAIYIKTGENESDQSLSMKLARLLFSLVIGLIGGLLSCIPVFVGGEFAHQSFELEKSIPIYSLTGGEGFILGSRSIEASQAYYYYALDEDGSLNPETLVDTKDSIRVYQEDRTDGVIEIHINYITDPFLRLIFIPLEERKYKIHVPNGSLQPGLDF